MKRTREVVKREWLGCPRCEGEKIVVKSFDSVEGGGLLKVILQCQECKKRVKTHIKYTDIGKGVLKECLKSCSNYT